MARKEMRVLKQTGRRRIAAALALPVLSAGLFAASGCKKDEVVAPTGSVSGDASQTHQSPMANRAKASQNTRSQGSRSGQ